MQDKILVRERCETHLLQMLISRKKRMRTMRASIFDHFCFLFRTCVRVQGFGERVITGRQRDF